MRKEIPVVKERTEEEKVAQATFTVVLGGKEYQIAPLVIRDAREWRKKIVGLVVPLPRLVATTSDDETFEKILADMLVTMPDQVIDLFFEYAKDLNREEIEGIATEAEIGKAFEEVIKIAFPLAESLPNVMTRFSR